jgi:hypothetical protein
VDRTGSLGFSIVGQAKIQTFQDLKRVRVQEIAFRLAKLVLEKYFLDKDGEPKRWLFPITETVFRCIVKSTRGDKIPRHILYQYKTIGSRRWEQASAGCCGKPGIMGASHQSFVRMAFSP